MNKVIDKIMYVVPANEWRIILGAYTATLSIVFIYEYIFLWTGWR